MARKLAAVPTQAAPPGPPDLREAVAATLKQMTWRTPADEGMSALALWMAEEIETAAERAEQHAALLREAADDPGLYGRLKALEAACNVTKTVGLIGPQLQAVLRDLGGAPVARKALTADKKVGGRLAQLRAAAGAGEHDS